MKKTFRLILLQIKYDWLVSVAYLSKNIFMLSATLSYTLFYTIFYKIVFGKVNTIAGYTKNDAMFLFFVAQLTFYSTQVFVIPSLKRLSLIIANGQLDYVLIRPYSSLLQVSVLRIVLMDYLSLASIPLVFLALQVRWLDLNMSPGSLFVAIIIQLCGYVIYHCIGFVLTCLTIYETSLRSVTKPLGEILDVNRLPFEGYGHGGQLFLTTLIPVAFLSVIPVSVAINKSDSFFYLIFAISVCISLLIIKYYVWKVAIKYYSSAGG